MRLSTQSLFQQAVEGNILMQRLACAPGQQWQHACAHALANGLPGYRSCSSGRAACGRVRRTAHERARLRPPGALAAHLEPGGAAAVLRLC